MKATLVKKTPWASEAPRANTNAHLDKGPPPSNVKERWRCDYSIPGSARPGRFTLNFEITGRPRPTGSDFCAVPRSMQATHR